MIGDLAAMDARRVTSTAGIDFAATDRRTKKLLVAEGLAARIGDRTLFEKLNITLTPGLRLGLAGGNGSGKTTLLRMLLGELRPSAGTIVRADNLQEVYFDQHRDQLDMSWTLREALAPEGDSVIYLGRVIHVNAWAKRFLFDADQLDQPVDRLSGGERARVLIARLMLRPADILLLTSPPTISTSPRRACSRRASRIFPALCLVTHDRYLLDRVSTHILGLDGAGGATLYADYAQWEAELSAKRAPSRLPPRRPTARMRPPVHARNSPTSSSANGMSWSKRSWRPRVFSKRRRRC